MIDFSNLPVRNKTYAGANGSKISVLYNGEQYMLKFPPAPSRNQAMSYTGARLNILGVIFLRVSESRCRRRCSAPIPEKVRKRS